MLFFDILNPLLSESPKLSMYSQNRYSEILLQVTKTEVISDANYEGIHQILTRIYINDYDNTVGICVVKVHENGVAEIDTMKILNEANRRKHYGSKLWEFAENYVIRKYHPSRFVGELDSSNIPAVEFWKSQNFQMQCKESDYGTIVKEVKP